MIVYKLYGRPETGRAQVVASWHQYCGIAAALQAIGNSPSTPRQSGLTYPMRTPPLFLTAVVAISAMVATARANPVKYEFDPTVYVDAFSGWFVYDRAAGTLSDYSLTYKAATFTYPAGNIYSAGFSGFTFSDETIANANGQTYDVLLGSFQPWFELHPYGPVVVNFDSSLADSGGTLYADVYWLNLTGSTSGIEHPFGVFRAVGPANSVPESGATLGMLLTGLALLGWVRRK